MTKKLREAAQQALNAMDQMLENGEWYSAQERADALREALAESERDWSLLEATQESLREHMAKVRQLQLEREQAEAAGLTTPGGSGTVSADFPQQLERPSLMHPIHYSALLSMATVLGGLLLAYDQREPLVFVIAILAAWLLGGQTVGRFSDDRDAPGSDDYQGTGAGFMQD